MRTHVFCYSRVGTLYTTNQNLTYIRSKTYPKRQNNQWQGKEREREWGGGEEWSERHNVLIHFLGGNYINTTVVVVVEREGSSVYCHGTRYYYNIVIRCINILVTILLLFFFYIYKSEFIWVLIIKYIIGNNNKYYIVINSNLLNRTQAKLLTWLYVFIVSITSSIYNVVIPVRPYTNFAY